MILAQDGPGDGKRPADASEQEAARLKALFEGVDLPEITGIDLRRKTWQEIAQLLPVYEHYEGNNPVFGVLIDAKTGKAYALRSGWVRDPELNHNGIPFQNGNLSLQVAQQAGEVWEDLGSHVEAQVSAFMRKREITEMILYINAGNPCYLGGIGCYFRLPKMLAVGSKLTVFNRCGRSFATTRLGEKRNFSFVGEPD